MKKIELLEKEYKQNSCQLKIDLELMNQELHRKIWREAQRELLEELLKKKESCCGAGEYCYEEGLRYECNKYTNVIHVRTLMEKLENLEKKKNG